MKIGARPFVVGGSARAKRREILPDERQARGDDSSTSRRGARPHDHDEDGPRSRRVRDRLDVSSQAEIFSAALDAARQTPAIRPALVAELQAMIANGEVGNDVERLANRLIDSIEAVAVSELQASRRGGHVD